MSAISKETKVESQEVLDPKNPEDFAQLVERHHRELLIYARSLTHETNTSRDLVQDAFVVAYQKVDTFDVTRDFATWMRGIVRNKWREWLRRNSRYELSDKELSLIDTDIAQWQAAADSGRSDLFDALEQCLQRLPETLHQTVMTFYYQGYSGDEAAQQLGVAPAAVRKRLQRARTMLKDCVDLKLDQQKKSND